MSLHDPQLGDVELAGRLDRRLAQGALVAQPLGELSAASRPEYTFRGTVMIGISGPLCCWPTGRPARPGGARRARRAAGDSAARQGSSAVSECFR